MQNASETKFRRLLGVASVPVCLIVLMTSLPGLPVQAAQIDNNDKIVLTSGETLNDTDMDAKRGSGGTSTNISVASNQTLSSSSTGNTVNVGGSLTNGAITTGDNFGGSGIGSFVMNTGNNSTINSGVSLSILMLQ